MDMPVNVPVDDPNADTEWNDILRKHGVIPEKPPSPTAKIEEALTEARRLAHENRLEGKDLDELHDLEDEEDEEFLEQYRKQRLQELSTLQQTSIYNQVYPLQKAEYSREVTETSQKAFVCVLLTSSLGTNTESAVSINLWRDLAARFGDVKFCQIRADLCIEGYPEKNTPTVLIYKDGDIRRQIVTLRELQGAKTTTQDFERVLVDVKAVKDNDSRLTYNKVVKEEGLMKTGGLRGSRKTKLSDDEDSDWD